MDRDEMQVRVFEVLLRTARTFQDSYDTTVDTLAEEAIRVVDAMRPRRARNESGRFLPRRSDMAEFTRPESPTNPNKAGAGPYSADPKPIGLHGIAHPQEPLQAPAPGFTVKPGYRAKLTPCDHFGNPLPSSTATHFQPDTEADIRSFPGERGEG